MKNKATECIKYYQNPGGPVIGDCTKGVIEKAKSACKSSGNSVQDHFLQTGKMVSIGSGAERKIEDIMLTR